ncbi:DUF6086 family protein [Nocardia brasiliensis]|uniref:Uncharacterized protein n=1 Tax=Nocardia brasiliensis (strain ATCC 700358 / HUJEG-1) TaxID=1133849 RepID=K0ENA4_NOCB7|nr:DUF6086 family protein [Nocardia brasiliensis]AFT98856.1 hypothetical protein O3I_004470 [Nocardia brasiliensis ATCC 700358]OCF84603.1 hypothetical protein AW168_40640 [Nocardia brasiliensis]
MSYVFEIGDETVWSPSLRVGDLYVRMLREVASVLGMPAGLSAVASDMCNIDIEVFGELVNLMHETYFTSSHHVLEALIGGVLAPSLVILERSGLGIPPRTEEEREFHDWARRLSMAR